MVHYKYIRKKGKLYGPYLYENKRVNGKVVTSYLGSVSPDKFSNKRSLVFYISAFAVILLLFLAFWQLSLTGRASLDIKSDYEIGEELTGRLKLNIKEGELIPGDSKVIVSLGGETKEFALADLINAEVISGDFFVDNFAIEGNGEGYGLAGENIIYPEVNFDLRIFSEKENKEVKDEEKGDIKDGENKSSEESASEKTDKNESEINEGGSKEEGIEPSGTEVSESERANKEIEEGKNKEVKQEDSKEEANNGENKDTKQEGDIVGEDNTREDNMDAESPDTTESTESVSASETVSEGSSESAPADEQLITGAVISEQGFIVNGAVKKDNDFIYNLEEGQTAEIVKESVKINGSAIDNKEVRLNVESGKAIISTEYSIVEKGFGNNYLGSKEIKLEIDFSKFGLKVSNGTELNVKLVYNNETLVEVKKDISIKDKDEEELNESLINETVIINETEIELNLTFLNVSLIKNIPDIRIAKNSSVSLNLSEYFSGAERYEFEISDLTASFEGEILTIRPDEIFSGMRKAEIVAYSGAGSIESNEFRILVSSGAISISTSRKKIVVGEPVVWKVSVSLESLENITIDIPAEAENISVKKIVSGLEEKANTVITGMISADLELDKSYGLFRWLNRLFGRGRLTGRAVDNVDSNLTNNIIQVELNDDAKEYIVEYTTKGPESREEETKNGKRVIVSGDDKYNYTDVIASSKLSNKIPIQQASRIRVYWQSYESAGESFDIKDVDEVEDESILEELNSKEFADNFEDERNSAEEVIVENDSIINESLPEINDSNFEINSSEAGDLVNDTDIGEGSVITGNAIEDVNTGENNSEIISNEANISVNNESVINNSSVVLDINVPNDEKIEFNTVKTLIKHEIPYDVYDLDEDGYADYIEWVVPHLSNQTFDIILITKAEHLDENRTFIENVYDLVSARDEVWTEPIPKEHYVRVTFEQNLTFDRDITIYARAGCSENSSVLINEIEVPCEVYLKKLRIDELRRGAA